MIDDDDLDDDFELELLCAHPGCKRICRGLFCAEHRANARLGIFEVVDDEPDERTPEVK